MHHPLYHWAKSSVLPIGQEPGWDTASLYDGQLASCTIRCTPGERAPYYPLDWSLSGTQPVWTMGSWRHAPSTVPLGKELRTTHWTEPGWDTASLYDGQLVSCTIRCTPGERAPYFPLDRSLGGTQPVCTMGSWCHAPSAVPLGKELRTTHWTEPGWDTASLDDGQLASCTICCTPGERALYYPSDRSLGGTQPVWTMGSWRHAPSAVPLGKEPHTTHWTGACVGHSQSGRWAVGVMHHPLYHWGTSPVLPIGQKAGGTQPVWTMRRTSSWPYCDFKPDPLVLSSPLPVTILAPRLEGCGVVWWAEMNRLQCE
jgi:hypothetical protein